MLTPTPMEMSSVPSGVTFTRIAVSYSHSLAFGSDGRAYAWGSNSSGQLGDGTTTTRNAPVPVDVSGLPAGTTFTQP